MQSFKELTPSKFIAGLFKKMSRSHHRINRNGGMAKKVARGRISRAIRQFEALEARLPLAVLSEFNSELTVTLNQPSEALRIVSQGSQYVLTSTHAVTSSVAPVRVSISGIIATVTGAGSTWMRCAPSVKHGRRLETCTIWRSPDSWRKYPMMVRVTV